MGKPLAGSRVRLGLLLVVCLAFAPARAAFAQEQTQTQQNPVQPIIQQPQGGAQPETPRKPRERQPYRGLFGGTSGDPSRHQSLDFSLTTFGNYYENLTTNPAADPRFTDSYLFSGVGAGLQYSRNWTGGSFTARSASNFYYYPDYHEVSGVGNSVMFDLAMNPGQRLSFGAGGSVGYSPFYGMGGFFGGNPYQNASLFNPLYGVIQRDNLQLLSNVNARYELTRRTYTEAYYTGQNTYFTEADTSFGSRMVGARLGHTLTRTTAVHAGYGRGWGNYWAISGSGAPVTQHNIDVGLDYGKSLSRRKQSTFGFSTGMTAYSTADRTYYNWIAAAHIDTEVGRSWNVGVYYSRGLNWLQGFYQPLFSDMLTAEARGFLGTRLETRFDIGYSNGYPGLTGGSRGVDTYTGRATARCALSRYVGLSTQYLYYRYSFSADSLRPFGIAPKLDRQSVQFGLDLWLPLLR